MQLRHMTNLFDIYISIFCIDKTTIYKAWVPKTESCLEADFVVVSGS